MSFPNCGESPLGIYPIVDSANWVKRLLPLGVTSIQLRIKEQPLVFIEKEIIESIIISEQYQARLFINDYWQLAIKHQAYGVHLGQTDLDIADHGAIAHAGLRLGISTHCHEEVERVLDLNPSYLAYGPVYKTFSKDLEFSPRTLTRLNYWRQSISCPLVAIGGITLERLSRVMTTNVDGIALISAITHSKNPELVTETMLEVFKSNYEKR